MLTDESGVYKAVKHLKKKHFIGDQWRYRRLHLLTHENIKAVHQSLENKGLKVIQADFSFLHKRFHNTFRQSKIT